MLFVIFHVGDQHSGGARYALNASNVVEVLPLVHWTSLTDAPVGVAGVFNYHGSPVPLLDISERLTGESAKNWMSTRIIVVRRGEELFGLLAERVTDTLRQDDVDFRHGVEGAKIAVQSGGMIQLIDIEGLFRRDECHLPT